MKQITYEFADGTKSVIEVEDKWADMITVSRRKEENSNRKYRYWVKVSMDTDCEYEGDWFVERSPNPAEQNELKEQQLRVNEFLKTLTPVQRRRFAYRLDDPSISLREIARQEGTSYTSVKETFEQIEKKHRKFFEK